MRESSRKRKLAEQTLRRMNARFEDEATRIAHALHDEAGQLLSTVYLAVAEVAAELPAPARERLKGISALLGAQRIASLATEIERSLRTGSDEPAIKTLASECEGELAGLSRAIRTISGLEIHTIGANPGAMPQCRPDDQETDCPHPVVS